MRKHFICGQLFTGLEETAESDQTIVIDDDRVTYVGSSDTAPEQRPDDEVLDYSRDFVLPGLIDIHVHLSYGNAQSNEDIDMYSTPEFLSLRAMHAAQRVLAAGYTDLFREQAGCEFDSVSFHPYQDLKEFELCHNESKKVTRQQNKDAAESWTAAGGDDGVQTGAHHGAYEKNGLKTVKKPARAV